MARKLRCIPDPNSLVSITYRTVQGPFLFKPGPGFNDRFLGILGLDKDGKSLSNLWRKPGA